MARRFSDMLTLASAVICVGSLMWVARSMFRVDGVEGVRFPQARHGGTAWVLNGQVGIIWGRSSDDLEFFSEPAAKLRWAFEGAFWDWPGVRGIQWLGIGWGTPGIIGVNARIVILPLWLVPILSIILPARWWRLRRFHGRGFAVVEAPAEQT